MPTVDILDNCNNKPTNWNISVDILLREMLSFQAGKLTEHYDSRILLTKDKVMFSTVCACDSLETDPFDEPCHITTYSSHFTKLESTGIESETQTLLQNR